MSANQSCPPLGVSANWSFDCISEETKNGMSYTSSTYLFKGRPLQKYRSSKTGGTYSKTDSFEGYWL